MKPARLIFLLLLLAFASCAQQCQADVPSDQAQQDRLQTARENLVRLLERQGITDDKVLNAMRNVLRHEFVPEQLLSQAYANRPLPIGMGQTISQPYIVAYMSEALKLKGGEKVLEIGTGSGYQAAILAEIAGTVYTVEILEPLAKRAEKTLEKLGYENIFVRVGDGYQGWPEHAPFDAIMVTAAPDHVPEPLVEQLKVGGRMIIPVGERSQRLVLITKDEKGVKQERDLPVLFVPMTGEAEKQ